MKYETTGQFGGSFARSIELTAHVPWLYIIVASRPQIVYIGETFDQGGLVVRLGRQFGPYTGSTLRQRAAQVAGIARLGPPLIVVAARLPYGDDGVAFDASSKQVRLLCEAVLHELVASRFIAARSGWTIISDPQPSRLTPNRQFFDACEGIYDCFDHSFEFLKGITAGSPFTLVVLDQEIGADADYALNAGQVVEGIEVRVNDWIVAVLKTEFGDAWWTKGIPQGVRVQCAQRMEEEGTRGYVPPEAYLTFIDLRSIIQRNWSLFSARIESIGGSVGKDRATRWLVDVNEVRKLWAHPLKQRYTVQDPKKLDELRKLRQRIVETLR